MNTFTDTAPALDVLETDALAALTTHLPTVIELRHQIHSHPRLGGDEHTTRATILETLSLPATDVAEGMYLRIGAPTGPAIAVRAELDGLPIQELSDVPWASSRPGVAHLCGHDVHAAALSATLLALQDIDLPVPFIAAFQPREEVMPSGARDFIGHPGFLREEIAAMIGVHLQPALREQSISLVPGPVNASADDFDIDIRGIPSHGAYPHLGRDPIIAASAVVNGIQQLVSRRIDPMHPSVITVGRISGGDSHNQVPGRVTLQGTIRSYSEHDREFLHDSLRSLVHHIAAGYDCEGTTTIKPGEPVLDNDHALAVRIATNLHNAGFDEAEPFRSCGADDFAFYSQHFPSAMIFAGVGDATPGVPGLHHPSFVPADHVVATVAQIMIRSYFAAASGILTPEGTPN